MTSALAALGAHLATFGVGLPFDPLSAGYALGRDTPTTVRLLRALVHEADKVTAEVHDVLPNGFPTTLNTDTLAALDQIAPESGGEPGNGGGGGGGGDLLPTRWRATSGSPTTTISCSTRPRRCWPPTPPSATSTPP